MKKTFSFEKSKVWQEAKSLSILVYSLTKIFPEDERFGLTSQMRRSAVSIASNIAEGTGRHTEKDKARFTAIAYGSSLELLNQTIISSELNYISDEKYELIRLFIEKITRMLNGLYKSQLTNSPIKHLNS
ncbi:four helix bundle protein [Leptobacterium sp. I13]|uniref:four helix bundle protein n=1 Tax=Leptobacterium meishanense TaxID=3128904 RepID=UPI0030EC5357